ncbi:helix-turn-helix transcriptional regulator [Sphingobium herbicidovorans]
MSNKTLDADGTPFSLRQAIDALTSEPGLHHIRLRLDLPIDKPKLFLEGFRLPARPWSLGKLPHAIVIANAPRRDRAGIAAFLTTLYGMTPAEADIAMRLYDGKSRGEIAAERSVTAETLRGQIKSLYAKAAVDNEAALMRLLAAIMS